VGYRVIKKGIGYVYEGAVSYCVGAHSSTLVRDTDWNDDDDDATDAGEEEVDSPAARDPQQNNVCEVCLVTSRDARLAPVPCGHEHFCCTCVEQVEQQQLNNCPICRSQI